MSVTELQRKTIGFSGAVLKADEARGEITALGNIGNVRDLQGDVIAPGAWAKVLSDTRSGAAKMPAICWNHDPADVRGRVTYLEELPPGDGRIGANRNGKGMGDASALLFKARMAMQTPAGRDAWHLMAGGFVDSFSVGFDIAAGDEKSDHEGRTIKLINRLYEISATISPASVGSDLIAAKAAFARASDESRAYWERMGRRPEPLNMGYWKAYARAAGEAAAERALTKEKEARMAWRYERELEERQKEEAKRKAEAQEEAFAKRDAVLAAIYQQDHVGFARYAPAYWRHLARGRIAAGV